MFAPIYDHPRMELVNRLTPLVCRSQPTSIFVFGDNLVGKGKAGQACIRDESNAFGIPTKVAPSMEESSFFSDGLAEFKVVREKCEELLSLEQVGRTIYLPSAGIGTGLAQLEKRSPLIYSYIKSFFDVGTSNRPNRGKVEVLEKLANVIEEKITKNVSSSNR